METKDSKTVEKHAKSLLSSYSHTRVTVKSPILDEWVSLFKTRSKKFGKKKPLFYNKCCHNIGTSYHNQESGAGSHLASTNMEHSMQQGSCTRQEFVAFLSKQGFVLELDVILPSLNLDCQNYHLAARFPQYDIELFEYWKAQEKGNRGNSAAGWQNGLQEADDTFTVDLQEKPIFKPQATWEAWIAMKEVQRRNRSIVRTRQMKKEEN